jgi:hypothetical protein
MERGDVLMLAGDIVVARALDFDIQRQRYKHYFNDVSEKFDHIYIIAGNHEHYGSHINETDDKLRHFYSHWPNVHYMVNECVELTSEVMLWAGTFWTDYNLASFEAMDAARTGMSDHFEIRKGDGYFMPADALEIHQQAVLDLGSHLAARPDKPFIVMTHHVPFYHCLNLTRWGANNLVNYAFACTDMLDLLFKHSNIVLWHAGHTHDANDRIVESTRVIINPRGYPGENPVFKTVTVDLEQALIDWRHLKDEIETNTVLGVNTNG